MARSLDQNRRCFAHGPHPERRHLITDSAAFDATGEVATYAGTHLRPFSVRHHIGHGRMLIWEPVGRVIERVERAGTWAVLMRGVVDKLTNDDIVAISACVGSQDP